MINRMNMDIDRELEETETDIDYLVEMVNPNLLSNATGLSSATADEWKTALAPYSDAAFSAYALDPSSYRDDLYKRVDAIVPSKINTIQGEELN